MSKHSLPVVVTILSLCCLANSYGQPPSDSLTAFERQFEQLNLQAYVKMAIGVTRSGKSIKALVAREDLDPQVTKTRVLLIGGLDGKQESVELAMGMLRWFTENADARPFAKYFVLSAVPLANPEGLYNGQAENTAGGDPTRGYLPSGPAYGNPKNPEAEYLWRWIGMQAPNFVVDVRAADARNWRVPRTGQHPRLLATLAKELSAELTRFDDELVAQLVRVPACEMGTIPALQLEAPAGDTAALAAVLTVLKGHGEPSPARGELLSRLKRTPLEIAQQLSRHYGHDLDQAVYIPAVALIGRLKLGELTGDRHPLSDVERIVAPYFTGEKNSLGTNPTGSHLSGHLVFAELARLTKDSRYTDRVLAAANLGFDAQGRPRDAMPLHSEMSDAVFMGCPILAEAGRLTGDAKYFQMCLTHMRFMLELNLRQDGLHRHSPLDDTAWGRGNGFPALGLALCLSAWPEKQQGREEMLAAWRSHLAALAPHQDATGCWRQVVDMEGSYRELSCTSMIAFAMIRGVRQGWLPRDEYAPRIERAWQAIAARISADGRLVDVCTGTGKQRSLRDYLDRAAILGRDPRGGAMALLVATEMAAWKENE